MIYVLPGIALAMPLSSSSNLRVVHVVKHNFGKNKSFSLFACHESAVDFKPQ